MTSNKKIKRIMKRVLFITCIMAFLSLYACASGGKKPSEKPICAEWLLPDSSAYSKLGKRLSTVLFSPQKVNCYYLVGKEKISKDDVEIEAHFVRDSFISKLGKGEIAVLQYSLLKPSKSYEKNDSVIVMSPYMPILEFEFIKKNEIAHVVVSLSDMTWTIIFDDKKQFNFPYANGELISQFCNYYISKYKSEEK